MKSESFSARSPHSWSRTRSGAPPWAAMASNNASAVDLASRQQFHEMTLMEPSPANVLDCCRRGHRQGSEASADVSDGTVTPAVPGKAMTLSSTHVTAPVGLTVHIRSG